MLMNGKKVNNLVINGETFTLETYLPCEYQFGAKNAPFYRLEFDTNSKVVMVCQTSWASGSEMKLIASLTGKCIVSKILTVDGEQFALTHCRFSTATSTSEPYNSAEGSVWIKVSESGGMTRIEATGDK